MGATGNRGSQLASRNVLNDFTDDTLIISAGSIFQKWDSPNTDIVLATVELIGVVAWSCVDWVGKDGPRGEFQRTMGDLEHGE